MTTWVWLVLGAGLIVAGLIVGLVLALATLIQVEWDPDRDGFSEEDQ